MKHGSLTFTQYHTKSWCYHKPASATKLMKIFLFIEPADASSECVHPERHLGLLHVLLFNADSASAVSTLAFLKPQMLVRFSILFRPVNILLEHRIGLKGLELGFEAVEGVAVSAAVGATTGVGEVVTIILGLIARSTPGTITMSLIKVR